MTNVHLYASNMFCGDYLVFVDSTMLTADAEYGVVS